MNCLFQNKSIIKNLIFTFLFVLWCNNYLFASNETFYENKMNNFFDPFKPLVKNDEKSIDSGKKEFSKLNSDSIKLVGIMYGDKKAVIVENRISKKSLLLFEGMKIFSDNQTISEILKDRIIIQEIVKDSSGKNRIRKKELRIFAKSQLYSYKKDRLSNLSAKSGDAYR